MAPKIMKNDVLYMGVKKLLVLVGGRWGVGGLVEMSCGTIIIVSGSKNREK